MPKITARRDMTTEQLKASNNDYYRQYYAKNKNNKDIFKTKTKISIIDNSINRVMRDDEFIKMFINKVGCDRMLELMGYENTIE